MMKLKSRYILVESAAPIGAGERKDFEPLLCRALLHQIGELNYHKANPKVAGFVDERKFVLKCNLDGYRSTILALSMVKRLENRETAFYTLSSSGTLKALLKTPHGGK
jgi:RNase P/RNase MRP subunit POP5